MITYKTTKPEPGDTVHYYSRNMTVDCPWYVLPKVNAKWELAARRQYPASNFNDYHFIAVEKPARDEYSAEWLDSLERAA